MDFRILGPLEVRDGERAVPLGGTRRRAVLALLLLDANRVVPVDRLVDGVWGDEPPPSAVGSLQNHVLRLRRELGDRLLTRAPGYRLRVEPHELDLLRFRQLVEGARGAEPGPAAESLRQALALWRGPALADLAGEPVARAAAHLDELRLGALEDRIDADLALGREADLVSELEDLVREHPFRERTTEQLMLALYRSGRQAEALAAYEALRRRLDEELGAVPGRSLRELHRAILGQAAALEPEEAREQPGVRPVAAREARRTVTVLAAGLSTAGWPDDPEARRAGARHASSSAAEAVERHGGTVIASEPESLLAAFGAPAAHDDDALRAVRAAFELAGAGTAVRAGIATGEVIAGAGPSISGAAVGEAAGLRNAAEAGAIVASERTWRLVRHAVTAEAVPGGRRLASLDEEAPALLRRLETPLVGRDRELQRILDTFAEAVRQNRAQLLTVFGEPGVGKTRLAGEASAQLAAEATILTAVCRPYGQDAYGPLRAAVAAAAGDDPAEGVRSLLAGERDGSLAGERIAGALGAGAGAGSPEETAWAFRRLFETLARRRPLVLLVEDVHWASASLLDLLDHVVELARRPILVLCLARPDLLDDRPGWGGGKVNAASFLLDALSEEESVALLARLAAGSPLASDDAAQILGSAGGNPLFLEQLLAAVLEERAGAVPDELHALLATRLDRLDAAAREAVDAAAVAGEEFTSAAVEELLGRDVRSTLESLVRRELIRPCDGGPTWAFRHALIREAAYAALPKARRAAFHEALAEGAAQRREPDEVVGYHLEQAAAYLAEVAPGDPRARPLALAAAKRLHAAADRAVERADMAAAGPLLARTVALYPAGDPARDRALVRLADAKLWTGDTEAASHAIAEARRGFEGRGDAIGLAYVLLEESVARSFGAQTISAPELLAAAEQAIAVFEQAGDDEGLAWAHLHRFHGLMRDFRGAPIDEELELALMHARAAGARLAESDVLGWLLITLRRGGVPVDAALARAARIRDEAPTQSVRAAALSTLSLLHAMQGRFELGRELAAESSRLLGELGLATALAAHSIGRAEIELLADRLDETERILRRGAQEIAAAGGDAGARANLAWELALVLLRQGRDDEALEWERVAGENPTPGFWVEVWRLVIGAVVGARRGEGGEAGRLVSEALAALGRVGESGMHADVRLELAEAVALLDGPEAARKLLEEAAATAERLGYTVARERAWALLRGYGARTA